MKRPLTAILLAALLAPGLQTGAAASGPLDCELDGDDRCETFSARSNRATNDTAIEIAASPDGTRVFMASMTSYPFGQSADIITTAFDMTGQTLWTKTLGEAGSHEEPTTIVTSPIGDLVAVVGSEGASSPLMRKDGELVATVYRSTTGEEL